MKIVRKKTNLPNSWSDLPSLKDVKLEANIRLGSSKLLCKVLVFKNQTQLRRFWRDLRNETIPRECRAISCPLMVEVVGVMQTWIEVDPAFFEIICLSVTDLDSEVIVHEAVHAAFAYHNRVKRKKIWPDVDEQMEECICYPAGLIAASINDMLHKHKLYDEYIEHRNKFRKRSSRAVKA